MESRSTAQTLQHIHGPWGGSDFTGANAPTSFDIPLASGDDPEEGARVDITATRGDFDQDVTLNIPLPNRLSGRFQTNKPTYAASGH